MLDVAIGNIIVSKLLKRIPFKKGNSNLFISYLVPAKYVPPIHNDLQTHPAIHLIIAHTSRFVYKWQHCCAYLTFSENYQYHKR